MEDDNINVIIDFSHKISLIRFLGNTMMPSRLKIKAEVFASDTAEEIDFDVTFAKIKFWLETVVSRCIVFSLTNPTAMALLVNETGRPNLHNHLMITPNEPNNEHIAVLLQSKMAALSNGAIEFGAIRVETEDVGLVFTYVGDWHDDLPTMDDWFATKPYYFDVPWWRRNDASTLDLITDDADMNEMPPWAYNFDFLEKAIKPPTDKAEKGSDTDKAEKVSDKVIRGGFRPKVINGGKDRDTSEVD